MIITTEQIKNGQIRVYADSAYVFSASPEYWYSLGICEEDDVSQEQIHEIVRELEMRKCCNAAYAYLARRAYSVQELRMKLLHKYDEEAVDAAVEKAAELGLLDDANYAADYADELIRLKHYAPVRIKAELMKHGVPRECAELAVQNAEFEVEKQLEQLLDNKFKNGLQNEKSVKKTIASLMRMGYSYSEIRSAMQDRISQEVFSDEE